MAEPIFPMPRKEISIVQKYHQCDFTCHDFQARDLEGQQLLDSYVPVIENFAYLIVAVSCAQEDDVFISFNDIRYAFSHGSYLRGIFFAASL
jgi:hypothetical protein